MCVSHLLDRFRPLLASFAFFLFDFVGMKRVENPLGEDGEEDGGGDEREYLPIHVSSKNVVDLYRM
ncbi:hypothetical protein APY03_0487 [Variovorax sp. WDL1]|nr:hypothetical protein APY03_0487 [Variovorax sp. WDL1]